MIKQVGTFFIMQLPPQLKFILFPESDLAGVVIHGVYDCQRFQMIAQIPDDLAAYLKTLFHGNADAFYRSASLVYNGDQSLQGAAVGQEIIDDEDMASVSVYLATL